MSILRICFICGEYPPARHGGVGVATQSLARALARRGHEVRVIGIRAAEDGSADSERDEGVRVERLSRCNWPKIGWLKARYHLYRQVAQWAQAGEIDLVEAPDYEGWTAGWRALPVPVVARLHGSASYFAAERGRPLSTVLYRVERMALRRASFVCSCSQYTAKETAKLFRLDLNGVRVLYNSVAVANPGCWQPDGLRVVYTGTLAEKKGVIQLAKAWKLVAAACPDAELHFYGKDGRTDSGGSMREYLLSVLGSDATRVVFHGHISATAVPGILRRARVAVFPSYSEAFALAPLEAMAQGCPTVYSSRASGPELITHGQDGMLVDPGNTDGIAQTLITLLADFERSSRIAQNGQARVRDAFSTAVVVEQNETYFRSCITTFHN